MSEAFTVPDYMPTPARRGCDMVLVGAVKALRSQNWLKAERICRQVLRLDPNHGLAVHLLGLAAHRGGQGFDAVSLLRRSIELDQAQPIWWYNLGVSHAAGGQHEEAVECYRSALRLQPYHIPSLFMASQALVKLHAFTDAAASLAQVLRLDPTHMPARKLYQQVFEAVKNVA